MPRTVLVTGASSGIGAAAVRRFSAAGWQVAATMRRPETAKDLPAGAVPFALDVTDAASVDAAVAAALGRFGRIDVLVNNAGYGLFGVLEAFSDAQLRDQFETNVLGLMRVTRTVLPHMRAAGGGVIVNVSSIGGRMAFPLSSPYHGSKFAVEGLTDSLQHELRPFGIRLKLVEPGGIETEFGGRSMQLALKEPYTAMAERFMAQYRRRKLPGPERVADTILRAATDPSGRLRYLVHHQPYWATRQLAPDWLWRRMMQAALGS